MTLSRRLFLFLGLALAIPGFAYGNDSELREIIAKAIERHGGEKLAKFNARTYKVKGTIHVNGAPLAITGDIASQGRNQQRINVSLDVDGTAISYSKVVNGDQGWEKINDNTVDLSTDQLSDSKAAAYVSWVATLKPLKDKQFQLAAFGEVTIDGRKVVGINVTSEGQRSVVLFFDKETFRLARTETVVRDESTFKEVTEETTFSDFKENDGLPYAAKVTIKRNGVTHAEFEVEGFTPTEKLDDSTFAKP